MYVTGFLLVVTSNMLRIRPSSRAT